MNVIWKRHFREFAAPPKGGIGRIVREAINEAAAAFASSEGRASVVHAQEKLPEWVLRDAGITRSGIPLGALGNDAELAG